MNTLLDRTLNERGAKRAAKKFNCAYVMLGHGKFALIDKEDVPWVSNHRWRCHTPREYAVMTGPKKTLYLHRMVLSLPSGRHPEVDHINGNGLDNRRSNLRACDRVQNAANSRNIRRNKTSRYKGVRWMQGKWQARLKLNARHIHLGTFHSEVKAARAYDACALKTWGEFAQINFPI